MTNTLRYQIQSAHLDHKEQPQQSVHRDVESTTDLLKVWLAAHLPHSQPKPANTIANVTVQRSGEGWIVSLATRDGVFRGLDTNRDTAEVRCLTMAHGARKQN
jgi:hypothetical protein